MNPSEDDTRTIYALLTGQGTAAPETALCETHYDDDHREPIEDAAERRAGDPDMPIPGTWSDCSANPELECAECGYYRLDARGEGNPSILTDVARGVILGHLEEDEDFMEAEPNERIRYLNTEVDALRGALVATVQNFWDHEHTPFNDWMEVNASE